MMTNSEIARKITQEGIPEGMTLRQAFTRAIRIRGGLSIVRRSKFSKTYRSNASTRGGSSR